MKPLMRANLLCLAVVTLGALGACHFDSLTVAETDVVITIEDEKRDYSKYKTYALSDAVVDLCEVAGEDGTLPIGAGGGVSIGDCFDLKHLYDDELFSGIERNMKALGYDKVDRDEDPDVTLLVAAVTRNNWYYAPGYIWCDPFYYYSCWYPPVNYVYSIPTGTVLINMIDNSQSTTTVMASAWFAALSGLYAVDAEKTGKQRVEEAVDKAFAQSPYLESGR